MFSLFDYPNENISNKNVTCLMARGSKVSSSSLSTSMINDELNDDITLEVKEELVAFNVYMTNLQGEHKKNFVNLLNQLAYTQELLDKRCKLGREHILEMDALANAQEQEQGTRESLEEKT